VETVEGDGFVAVRKVDAPRARKGKPAPSTDGPSLVAEADRIMADLLDRGNPIAEA
jgi:hypothetical protein